MSQTNNSGLDITPSNCYSVNIQNTTQTCFQNALKCFSEAQFRIASRISTTTVPEVIQISLAPSTEIKTTTETNASQVANYNVTSQGIFIIK